MNADSFGAEPSRFAAERGTRLVALLTAVTMAAEVIAGWYFNSMALTADGWHMGTHALALGLSAFAYAYARRHAAAPCFTFGTHKVEVLGAYTSALFLLAVALAMLVESVERLRSPLSISFDQAALVAFFGLFVNVISAALLNGGHAHAENGAHHHHDEHGDGHEHRDLNLRAAYVHVLADAATSVLAIVALLGGKWLGWSWLDPAMGVVGAVLVALWARNLIRDSARVLLDAEMDRPTARAVAAVLEGVAVSRLRIWRVERDAYACLFECTAADEPAVRDRLARVARLRIVARAGDGR